MRPSSAQRCSSGNTFPGLSRCFGSNAHLTRCCCVEVVLVEHLRHQVALLDADAVLAGQHAADLDAEPQDVGAESLGRLELARLVGVIEDQRMQIAVAGMEDVGDAQPVLLRQLAHAGAAPSAAPCAGWCRPCSNSPARCVRRPGRPPCGRPRRTAAPARLSRRGRWSRRSSRAIASTAPIRWSTSRCGPVELDDQQRLAHRADSRHGRNLRPHGSPAGPSSPCRPG